MLKLKINNKEVNVPEGITVMAAARMQGFEIPSICYREGKPHFTSCMICMVKDRKSGKLFPSCSVEVTDGLDVITDDEEIAEARRTALELLLSEHVGDCEAPCQIACPAHMNIPLMNRLIAAGKFDESLEIVRRDIALPAVLGRICPAPCEGACHRKSVDEPVSICLLKRFVGEKGNVSVISPVKETDWQVAVIGAGPAGLAAAYYLQLRGIYVTLYDEAEKAGGQLRTKISEEVLPGEVLDREIGLILDTGVQFRGGEKITASEFAHIKKDFDAVVLAAGAIGEDDEHFGLKITPRGIAADKNTYQTSMENIFAIGNALRPSKLAIRSA